MNMLEFNHKELDTKVTGPFSDLSETMEPTYAPKMRTRGVSVPTQIMTLKEYNSQSNHIVQRRYSSPS